jgi:selenocysteine lyase/cysteine desulfurase
MTEFDIDFVRAQFPAFSDPDLAGWAFFENAGGSYPCRQTIERLHRFYTKTKVQTHGAHPLSQKAGAEMDAAYARLAPMLGVGEDELHLSTSTSQNVYVLAHAFRALWAEGDEVIVTDQDHEANGGPWRKLAESGIVVREWTVDPDTGSLDVARLQELITDRTRLVAFPHASNIVAEINPVAEICKLVRAAGAVSVVDGVSYAPHGLPDIGALGADIYLFSAYKTWGPHQGVMTVRRALADALPNQTHWFNAHLIRKKLVPAGPDHAQTAAMQGICDYVEALHTRHFTSGGAPDKVAGRVHDLMRARERALMAPLAEWLRGRNDIRILGPLDPERRAPTIAMATQRPGLEVAKDLARHKIMAGGGHFYARRLIEAMGIDEAHGCLRVSLLHYNTAAEVEQLIAALDATL